MPDLALRNPRVSQAPPVPRLMDAPEDTASLLRYPRVLWVSKHVVLM